MYECSWQLIINTPQGWVCKKRTHKRKLLHKLRKATKTCPRIVCLCGFVLAHVHEWCCHLFVFRTTAAVNFAALCFVWSLVPLHSANAAFLLSVTLKPLWSTVYSHSFGTLCPSSAAATQWLNERRSLSTFILRSSSSDSMLFWNNCSLEQKSYDELGQISSSVS